MAWNYNVECQEAFDDLKKAVMEELMLELPDLSEPADKSSHGPQHYPSPGANSKLPLIMPRFAECLDDHRVLWHSFISSRLIFSTMGINLVILDIKYIIINPKDLGLAFLCRFHHALGKGINQALAHVIKNIHLDAMHACQLPFQLCALANTLALLDLCSIIWSNSVKKLEEKPHNVGKERSGRDKPYRGDKVSKGKDEDKSKDGANSNFIKKPKDEPHNGGNEKGGRDKPYRGDKTLGFFSIKASKGTDADKSKDGANARKCDVTCTCF
ncbi:hypothetical protein Ancab_031985 [Ancistrocladus abbreviatus]